MPPDIYGLGGEVESPLFINFQRSRLDLSGVMENDRLRFELAKDLADRNIKLKQNMRDLKMPEGTDGNHNDLMGAYTMFQKGKQGMEAEFRKYGNVNAAMNSPEFARSSQMVAMATDPTINEMRKNKKKSTEAFASNMEARLKQGVDVSSNLMVDDQGLLVTDPLVKNSLITAHESLRRDTYEPDYMMDKPLGQQKLNAASLTTSDDFLKSLEEKLKTSAKTVSGGEWDDAAEVSGALANDPLLKLAMLTKQGRTTSNNVEQLNSAVKNVFATLSNSDVAGAYQGYSKTDDFAKRMQMDQADGGFLRNGVIDPTLIRNEMISGSGFGTKGKNGKGDMSYFQEVVTNAAGRLYDVSALNKLDRTMIKNGYSDGSGGSDFSKTTQWQHDLLHGPMLRPQINQQTGKIELVPGGEKRTMYFPVVKEMPGGEVVEVPLPVEAVEQKYPTFDMFRGMEKTFGLRADNGQVNPDGGLTLGDISPSWTMMTNSGTVVDKTKVPNAQIVKLYDVRRFIPPAQYDQMLNTEAVFNNQVGGVRTTAEGPVPDFNNPDRPVLNPVSGQPLTDILVKVRVKFSDNDNAPVEDRFLDWQDTPEGNKARMEYERRASAIYRSGTVSRNGGAMGNIGPLAGGGGSTGIEYSEKTKAAIEKLDEEFAGKRQQHGMLSKEPLFGPNSRKLNPTASDSWSIIGQEPGEQDMWLRVPPEMAREGALIDTRMFNLGVQTGDDPVLPQQNRQAMFDIVGSVVQPTDTTGVR